jgi:hypothetical protein
MKGLFRSKLFLSLVALVMVLLLAVTMSQTSRAHAANNSEQVVFSGTAQSANTQVYFWIWCESDSSNPYVGECNGSMSFPALHITKQVGDTAPIAEPQDGQYLMTVGSSDGSVSCMLENVPPPTKGPTNTVNITCTAPSLTAQSTNAVVNVTGPS